MAEHWEYEKQILKSRNKIQITWEITNTEFGRNTKNE
jgi:hypothetical protein